MALNKSNQNNTQNFNSKRRIKSSTIGSKLNQTSKSQNRRKVDFSLVEVGNEENVNRMNITTLHTRKNSGSSHSKYPKSYN